MSITDFTAHPIFNPVERELFNLDGFDFNDRLAVIEKRNAELGVNHTHLCLFDEMVFRRGRQKDDIKLAADGSAFSFSYLPDFRNKTWQETLNSAVDVGVKSVTFHNYLQKIDSTVYDNVKVVAVEAARAGLFICLCSAYGSADMFRFHILPLVIELAAEVTCPIVLVHGGGEKIRDALLIAEHASNIYLDTSFSLSWWSKSSVEIDFAFAINKLGPDRWMFGSDDPFVEINDAISSHEEFFARHDFSDRHIDQIMSKTANKLLNVK